MRPGHFRPGDGRGSIVTGVGDVEGNAGAHDDDDEYDGENDEDVLDQGGGYSSLALADPPPGALSTIRYNPHCS